MVEAWKDVVGYEGLYQVSNIGRVKSLDRQTLFSNGRTRLFYGQVLKNKPFGNYHGVALSKDGRVKNKYVHILVAQAFIQNPQNYPQINHKDENRFNNRFDNLEWCTQKYNNSYGTGPQRRGEKFSKPVLMIDKDGTILKRYRSQLSAQQDGFDQRHISHCCSGKQSKHKGYYWRFA